MSVTRDAVEQAQRECADKIRAACVEFHAATGLVVTGATVEHVDVSVAGGKPESVIVEVSLNLSDLRSRQS